MIFLVENTTEMDRILSKLKSKLPVWDYRTFIIRYTGVEIRQNPTNYSIEVGQEAYIESLQPVETKHLHNASNYSTSKCQHFAAVCGSVSLGVKVDASRSIIYIIVPSRHAG